MTSPIGKIVNAANTVTNAANKVVSTAGKVANTLNSLTAVQSGTNNGLPYNNVPPNLDSKMKRNIISWFIPQFGVVNMYVNPSSITYRHKKLITKEKTKGGFTLQYWGEDLTTLDIAGTTGSSGIEGINVLYEMYRAEQLAFDPLGLSLAGNNYSDDISHNLINGAASLVSGNPAIQSAAGGLLGGILGVDSPLNTLAAKNIPTLAQLAFTVEMYYGGWVYRGFFENMTVNEQANDFLIGYQITFTATQRRGYRTNYFPFSKSPDAPSSYTTPNSFSGYVVPGT
jgi:hypothetical protein